MKKFLLLIAATAFALLTTACTDSSGYTYETVKNDPLKTRIYTLDTRLCRLPEQELHQIT